MYSIFTLKPKILAASFLGLILVSATKIKEVSQLEIHSKAAERVEITIRRITSTWLLGWIIIS